jgi:hypothetical protein
MAKCSIKRSLNKTLNERSECSMFSAPMKALNVEQSSPFVLAPQENRNRITRSRCRQPTDALVGVPACHALAAEVEGDKSEILRLMTACMEARFDLERLDAQLRVAVAALERLRHGGEAFVVASEALGVSDKCDDEALRAGLAAIRRLENERDDALARLDQYEDRNPAYPADIGRRTSNPEVRRDPQDGGK